MVTTRSQDSKTGASQGQKRDVEKIDSPAKPKPSRAKKSKKSEGEASSAQHEDKPRLTTPDLEYDYDRSQLRDQRQTPGRVRRPRLNDRELDDDFRERFYIPTVEKPKGVSKNSDEFFAMKALADPSYSFHDLHVCHKKGRNGSPTYDDAGFQLDWEKVDRWMKPQPYNKRKMVSGMERAMERAENEQAAMYKSFFVEGKGPDNSAECKDYIKDHVSKDLGIPWHQIDSKKVKEWEERGFSKVKLEDWWHVPNKEERKRMMKMMTGASLRKDL